MQFYTVTVEILAGEMLTDNFVLYCYYHSSETEVHARICIKMRGRRIAGLAYSNISGTVKTGK